MGCNACVVDMNGKDWTSLTKITVYNMYYVYLGYRTLRKNVQYISVN